MLRPHPNNPLEYWFFKFNSENIALLVDWIARRKIGSGEVRISIQSSTANEVIFIDHASILDNGPLELDMRSTTWQKGDVQWDLTLESSEDRIRPQVFPAAQLKAFDLSVISAPQVSFTGWVEHRGNRYNIEQARGMISHYWGRRLPNEWWWISANQFNDPDICIECSILRSRIWGGKFDMPIGYFYYRRGSNSKLYISPPARISVTGSPDAFHVDLKSMLGAKISFDAQGREYNDFGEGIINTLLGDLQLMVDGKELAIAEVTAGLERRIP